jgi:superfamily II DNA/RNA helicase
VVGCPGRIQDFVNDRDLILKSCYYCVLDEADRMLDMGFEPQIRTILDECPSKETRQTCLFTATWPREVRTLADNYIKTPVTVQVGSKDPLTGNKDIVQHVKICQGEKEKRDALLEILEDLKSTNGNALVFVNQKRAVQDLQYNLSKREGVPCNCMHGDMAQRDRDWALEEFKTGRSRVMIATDVCARGLDVRNISIVVNWDPANNAEDHTHRVGRTGRAGDTGNAYTFLGWSDRSKAQDVLVTMKKSGQKPPDELLQIVGERSSGGGGGKAGWGSGGGWKSNGW